uniref:Putative LOC100197081 [Hydra vulgaris] n=1 Tax=Lepeophtheirus salmonis TaxID=72036 RepID=A0A0K2UAY3_LEPSM
MSRSSRRRKCCSDPYIFCYICACFTLSPQRRNIAHFVESVYLAYFKVPLGDQNKKWAPYIVCTTCLETLRSLSQGKNAKLKFGVPMILREPTNPLDDCYFCLVNDKGFNKKNKRYMTYPSIYSEIRPVPHSDEIAVPVFTKLADIDDEVNYTPLGSLFSQPELNDLIRDLNLPKQSAELLTS